MQTYANYAQHFRDLARCMTEIQADPDPDLCIYFGNASTGDHDHRISRIATPGGIQYAFHRASTIGGRIAYGSGEYIGNPDSPEPLIDVAQRWLQSYYALPTNPMIRQLLERKRNKDGFAYFIKKKESEPGSRSGSQLKAHHE